MSDERRKKQEARTEGPAAGQARKMIGWGVVVVLLGAAFAGGRYYRDHRYDNFAKCLSNKGAKMYGLYWCPHCLEQKEKFGASFQYVPYVECAIKGSREEATECKIAGVKLFPSWQFANEPPKEGVLSLEALSDKTGCALP